MDENPVDSQGTVADGFEPVRTAFEGTVPPDGDSADCCVYLDGTCVVDLRTGRGPDDLQCLFSATKGLAAACANLLVDRGLLDLDAPVAGYWPEFGAHGKSAVSVRWLLEHRSGVLAPDTTLTTAELADWAAVCAALADAAPAWEPGTVYGYHAQSFGWLVGELVRRVDGRSLADFLTGELAGPAHAEILLGLPAHALPRLVDVAPAMPPGMPPAPPPEAGGDGTPGATADDFDPARFTGPHTDLAMTFNGALPDDAFAVPRDPHLRSVPNASSNGYANARSLARCYAHLLTALSAPTLHDLTTPRTAGPDAVLTSPAMEIEQHFNRGFEVITPNPADPATTAFGHHALGGTVTFADPTRHLAFAYTTATAHLGAPGTDPRATALAEAVYACATR